MSGDDRDPTMAIIVFVAALMVLMLALIYVVNAATSCEARGGVLVRGPVLYECVARPTR